MIPREPSAWLVATLRSTAWLAITVAFLMCGWNQWWALGPFALGLTVAIALLVSLAVAIPRVVGPQNPGKKRPRMAPKTAISMFALVKYPVVATLIWWVVDHWESRSVVAFAGGFVCLQMVIGLRAAGRIWSDTVATARGGNSLSDDEGHAIAAGSFQQNR